MGPRALLGTMGVVAVPMPRPWGPGLRRGDGAVGSSLRRNDGLGVHC